MPFTIPSTQPEGTTVDLTGLTAFDITGIPDNAKKITVAFANWTGTGTGSVVSPVFQLGTASGFETTGYIGCAFSIFNENLANWPGFVVYGHGAGSTILCNYNGYMTLFPLDASNNIWSCAITWGAGNQNLQGNTAGQKTLSGTLTQIRLTWSNGTNTFAGGKIRHLVER